MHLLDGCSLRISEGMEGSSTLYPGLLVQHLTIGVVRYAFESHHIVVIDAYVVPLNGVRESVQVFPPIRNPTSTVDPVGI